MQSKLSSKTARGRRAPDAKVIVADLEARFVRFRAGAGRGARVPADLRAAALSALAGGVDRGELCRACKVSWSQVDAWQGSAARDRAPLPAVEPQPLRAFAVVDHPRPVERRPSPDRTLELRLGPWSVTVRFDDDAPRQDDPCCR